MFLHQQNPDGPDQSRCCFLLSLQMEPRFCAEPGPLWVCPSVKVWGPFSKELPQLKQHSQQLGVDYKWGSKGEESAGDKERQNLGQRKAVRSSLASASVSVSVRVHGRRTGSADLFHHRQHLLFWKNKRRTLTRVEEPRLPDSRRADPP